MLARFPILILTEFTWIRTLSESPEARVAMNYLSPHSVKSSKSSPRDLCLKINRLGYQESRQK